MCLFVQINKALIRRADVFAGSRGVDGDCVKTGALVEINWERAMIMKISIVVVLVVVNPVWIWHKMRTVKHTKAFTTFCNVVRLWISYDWKLFGRLRQEFRIMTHCRYIDENTDKTEYIYVANWYQDDVQNKYNTVHINEKH